MWDCSFVDMFWVLALYWVTSCAFCVYKRKSKKGTNVFSACHEPVIGLITFYTSPHLKFYQAKYYSFHFTDETGIQDQVLYQINTADKKQRLDLDPVLSGLSWSQAILHKEGDPSLSPSGKNKNRENLKDKKIKRNQLFFFLQERKEEQLEKREERKKMRNLVQKKMYMRADKRKA